MPASKAFLSAVKVLNKSRLLLSVDQNSAANFGIQSQQRSIEQTYLCPIANRSSIESCKYLKRNSPSFWAPSLRFGWDVLTLLDILALVVVVG